MILESVESGLLIWPSIVENGVTRPKKYYELSATEALQVDCDIKGTNIILQGLPPEVYALVSNHKVAKELWEKNSNFTCKDSLTKTGRECKDFYNDMEFARDFYSKRRIIANKGFIMLNGTATYLWFGSPSQADKFNVEVSLTFGVSLRMFTRSIVIQRRVEDL
ncbi:hypothetical protein Tco_1219374 [Tanacetum coccineum]